MYTIKLSMKERVYDMQNITSDIAQSANAKNGMRFVLIILFLFVWLPVFGFPFIMQLIQVLRG